MTVYIYITILYIVINIYDMYIYVTKLITTIYNKTIYIIYYIQINSLYHHRMIFDPF